MNSILLSQLYHCIRFKSPNPISHLLWACLGVCSILFPQYHALAHYFQVTLNVNFHGAFQLIYGNNLCFVTATIYYVFRRLFFVSVCFKNIYEVFSYPGHMWDSIVTICLQPALQTSKEVQLITWTTSHSSQLSWSVGIQDLNSKLFTPRNPEYCNKHSNS